MKKLLFIAAMAFTLTACEGPMGPVGPQGPQGQPGYNGRDGENGEDGEGGHLVSTGITVLPHHWLLYGKPDELNSHFVVTKSLDRLTQNVYDEGSVIAYIETVNGDKNGMPYVLHKGEKPDDGDAYLWTETYDFDFGVDENGGFVRFYLTYSDFATNIVPKEPVTFFIVMFWQ